MDDHTLLSYPQYRDQLWEEYELSGAANNPVMIGIAEAVVHEVCTQQAVIDAAQALNSLRMMIITE